MPAGTGIGQVVGLVRATRSLEDAAARIVVSGPGAVELAVRLAAEGDSTAVVVDGDPAGATVAIRLLDGDPSAAEVAVLRSLSRSETPTVVVRRGGAGHVPYVLPELVIEIGAGEPVPVQKIAARVADVAGDRSSSLAARLPVLRPAVTRKLVVGTALGNAVLAGSPFGHGAHLPLLTLSQCRMLMSLGVSCGETLPRDPQALALAVGPALAAALGVGLGARSLVRRSPLRGPLVRAAVAYGGTRVLGALGTRL